MRIDPADHIAYLRRASELARVPIETFVLPTDHHVLLHDMRFHYVDWGGEGTPPVVFIHGGGLNSHTWDMVCLYFRDAFHCLALDQRGHGDSEWSSNMDYSTPAYVSDIEAFVDRLELDQFILVGHSIGGLNSLAYAAEHSARLLGLVMIDTSPMVRVDGARPIRDFVGDTSGGHSMDDFVERAMAFNPLRDRTILRQSLKHNLVELPDGNLTWKYDRRPQGAESIEELAERMAGLWSVVPAVRCPTLIVRGGLSKRLLDEDAEELARALPNGRWLRVENAGHTVQGDNPAGLVEVLKEFFAEVTPKKED